MADPADESATQGQGDQGAPQADTGAQQAQAAEGQDGQGGQSDAFKEAAASIGAALGGLDGNTFDQGEQNSSLFNESSEQQQVAQEGSQQREQEEVLTTGDADGEPSPQGEEAPTEGQPAEDENAPGEQQQSNEQGDESIEIDNPLFEKQESTEKESTEAFSFESAEDFEKFFESGDFGITKDNLATELPKLVENNKKFEEVSQKSQNMEAVFNQMPKPIYEAIVAWSNGEDWKQPVVSHDSTDYSLEFGKQDAKQMVEKFHPGKVTAEDWEEYKDPDGDETTKAKVDQYLELTQGNYTLSQEQYKKIIQDNELQAQDNIKKAQASFDESRENLFKAFEDTPLKVSEAAASEIDKIAQSQQNILAEFYNADGTLRGDAHEKIAMLKHAKDMVVQQANALEKRVVSEARAELIAGTADQAAIRKTGEKTTPNNTEQAQEKAKQTAEQILGETNQPLF